MALFLTSGSLIDIARGFPENRPRTFREMMSIIRERVSLLEGLGMTEEAYHYARKAPYGRALTVLHAVNFMQYRHEISGEIFSAVRTLIASKKTGYKLLAIKLIQAVHEITCLRKN